MTLLIWTASKADIIREALDPPFSRIRDIPDHQVVPFEEGQALIAEAGDVVLSMGSKPLPLLAEHKIIPKGRAVDSLRQKLHSSSSGGHYLFTLDPFMVRTRADAPSLIAQDVALACRVAKTGSVDPVLGDYVYVDNFDELCWRIKQRMDQGLYTEVAGDLETLGLYPEAEGARIITAQFTDTAGKAYVYYVPADGMPSDLVLRQIRWLHSCPFVIMIGANYKYDLRWMRRHWEIDCTNFKRDTLLMGSIKDENRSNSLKAHAWEYTDLGGYDQLDNLGYDKGRMDLIPKEELLPYAGADADVTLQTGSKIKNELVNEGYLARLYIKVTHPASRGFELMEHEGVVVDQQAMASLRVELTETIESLEQQMFAMMPARLKAKYSDNLSITRAVILRDFFFSPYGLNLKPKMLTAKSEEPSTARAHLMMFHDHEVAAPFVELLTLHGSASKTKSTFVDGFMKHIRADGRLHPSYMLFNGSLYGGDNDDAGTVTGRTSCKDPAFQTMPSKTNWAKKLRACYPAPPGHLILGLDFAQGELKVVACVADERNMINAFQNGLDLHTVTAAEFMNITYEEFVALEETDKALHKLMRTGAKAGNFGLLYGMQAPSFREYARVQFGFPMTAEEAEHRRDKFLYELYPALPAYHEACEQFVKANGYIESPLGRRRHLPLVNSPDGRSRSDAVRQAINAPIQSTLNDLCLMALPAMQRELPQLRFFGMIHDALYAYVPIDGAEQVAKDAIHIMSNLPIERELGWEHELQFTADGELGPVLSKLEKVAA